MNQEKEQLNTKNSNGRVFRGVVVSNKMKDTATVLVTRFVKHTKYKKYYKVSKKYKAHDAGNAKQIGEEVEIRETRPISKDKHFIVVNN